MESDNNMDTVFGDESLPIKLRSYQKEMFERSLEGNTIVVMETGSGKTPVAIYRIMHALETIKNNKLVWFLAGSVALCRQQYESVRKAIPSAIVRIIVGADGPDLWGSPRTWKEVLNGVDIVLSTFAVLHSALEHAYVQIGNIALLIFDEAHHVTKEHPANKIMRDFYRRLLLCNDSYSLPAILGLTASPAENGKPKKLSELEVNLDAVCRTPREHRLELRQYVHRPSLERLEYDQDRKLDLSEINTGSLSNLLTESSEKFKDSIAKVKTKVAYLVQELGLWAAMAFVKDLVLILEDKVEREVFEYSMPSRIDKKKVLELLRPLADQLETLNTVYSQFLQHPFHVSTKFQRFLGHLNLLVARQQKQLVAIIFVRQRVVTAIMEKLLAFHPGVVGGIRSGAFVGESNSGSYEKQICELVVPRTQSDTLRDFRSGRINLIVATDSLDEGIDVAACNTIICFDPPVNLRSFIQKRGRARKEESTYTIMVPSDCSSMSPERFEIMEELMSQMIQEDRQKAYVASEKEAVLEDVNYVLQSNQTGAFMTAKSARAHLEHFCAKLPRVPYTDLRPDFTFREDASGLIFAQVRLPMSVSSTFRTATSARAWRTERAAIIDASFQAYSGLYKGGYLTEHLLPVDTKPFIDSDLKEQQLQFYHLGQQLCVWDQALEWKEMKQLFRTSVVVRNSSTGWISAGLAFWTYNDLSPIGSFELVAEGDQNLVVEFQSSISFSVDSEDILSILSSCTHTLATATRSTILIISNSKFAVFITPDLALNELRPWLQQNSGELAAQEFHENVRNDPPGLIANAAHGNSLHIFHGWHLSEDDKGNRALEIECTPFPKRRNFLKLKRSYQAPTQDETSDIEDGPDNAIFFDAVHCMVRMQAIGYAWVMRLVPSIFYHIEIVLLAERLKQGVLSTISIKNLSGLVCSITSPKTMLQDNYDRLEFLGDTVLKFHVSSQLYCDHPHWHEDLLSLRRSAIVANISLAKAAVARGIDRFIVQEPFTGKNWAVPSLNSISSRMRNDRHLRMKVVADVVESLVGTAFLDGGIVNARHCMAALLPDVRAEEPIFDKTTRDSKDSNKLVKHAEHVIGYSFRFKYILLEALTHPSCTRDAATEPYQRLEFLGDAVLDFLVAKHLFSALPNASQSLLTKIKSAVVNGDFLAFLCYSCVETWEGISYTGSVAAPRQCHAAKQLQGLWMMMRYESEAVADARQQGIERFDSLRQSISDVFESGKIYPWEELSKLQAPKFISDIIESILGAIFVDSDGNLEPCHAFLEKISLMKYLRHIITERTDVIHPKEKLNYLLCGRKMELVYNENPQDKKDLSMRMLVDDKEIVHITGHFSKDEAIIRATHAACKYFGGWCKLPNVPGRVSI